MIYTIIPVANGEPDLDWSNPPMESYQLNDTDRYCAFRLGTQAGASWTVITEAEYLAGKPAESATEAVPDTVTFLGQFMVKQTLVNAELQQKIDTIGQGVVELQIKQRRGYRGIFAKGL